MSGMVFRPRGGKRDVQLNITSLIDILFLLLIFFMLTSTFKRAGELELQLPESTTSTPNEGVAAGQVELVVTEEGEVILDGRSVDLSRLKGELERLRRDSPESQVMIKAETGVHHGVVVRILDMVRESGFPGVGIGTQMGGDEPR